MTTRPPRSSTPERRQPASHLSLMHPDLWPAEREGEPVGVERMREDLLLKVARSLLLMDPGCKGNTCARKICERSKCCETWAQNVRQFGARGAEVPNVKVIQRMMLEMIRRYGVSQRTQIR